MGWDEFLAAGVVERALKATVYSTDGRPIGLVEVGNGLVVLSLAILHDHVGFRPVAVDGQPDARSGRAGVAKKPVEAMLTKPYLTQCLVAEVEDVELVAGLSSHKSTVADTSEYEQGVIVPAGGLENEGRLDLGRRYPTGAIVGHDGLVARSADMREVDSIHLLRFVSM